MYTFSRCRTSLLQLYVSESVLVRSNTIVPSTRYQTVDGQSHSFGGLTKMVSKLRIDGIPSENFLKVLERKSASLSNDKTIPHPPPSEPRTTQLGRLTAQEYEGVLGLTFGSACLSFFLCAFAIYWLLRIKRNFRHEWVIMIQ